ncbi:DUF6252 family protein [Nonlabens sp.]|uniref:DUF6252 family protein n=1 Tax=Nonlabens sp. TaxID=1888209 RepID=UPI001BD01141|nr:DUF6252 family protein [Nonlabens sp.]
MKRISKYLLIALAIVTFGSCSENLEEDNVPAIQAVRNGEFFKSSQMSATVNADGTLSVIGQNSLERLEFNLEDDGVGIYRLGAGSQSEAIYTFSGSESFSSNLGNGTGEVRLTSVNALSGVTGTFSFVSYLANNADSLYMRKGVIFQVPFDGPLGTGGGSSSNSFNANVDGVALNPQTVAAVDSSGVILVSGSNSSAAITLSIPVAVTPGSYSFASSGDYTATYTTSGGASATSVTGTLEVVTADAAASTLSGTFNFVTGPPNNFDITNGAFSVSY